MPVCTNLISNPIGGNFLKVRLIEVAQDAGVTVNVASMILNRRPNCWASGETIVRVLEAAAELGHKPNSATVALRLGK